MIFGYVFIEIGARFACGFPRGNASFANHSRAPPENGAARGEEKAPAGVRSGSRVSFGGGLLRLFQFLDDFEDPVAANDGVVE